MTTITYRNGILAADSMETHESEGGGSRYHVRCGKLFRKHVTDPRDGSEYEVIMGMAGGSYEAHVFYDWYPGIRWLENSNVEKPDLPSQFDYSEPDFQVMIVEPDEAGNPVLYEADCNCRPVKQDHEYWAVGSGCKAALAAMYLDYSAMEAVEIAAEVDTYTREPFVEEKL